MNPSPEFPPLTPEDPRVTAYALGEMSPEERAAFEQAAAADPAIQAAVQDIRRVTARMEEALKEEPIEEPAKVIHVPKRSFWGFPHAYYFIGFAAAACLAVYIETRPPKPMAAPVEDQVVALTPFSVSSASAPIAQAKVAVMAEPADAAATKDVATREAPPLREAYAARAAAPAAKRFDAGRVLSAPSPSADSRAAVLLDQLVPPDAGALRYASLADLAKELSKGVLPQRGTVNLLRVVDSVPYAYPSAKAGEAFSVSVDAAQEPWAENRVLVRVGFRAREEAVVKRVRLLLKFDAERYVSASTWGYRESGEPAHSLTIPVGEIPAGMERTVVVELIRRPGAPEAIGPLSAEASYAEDHSPKTLEHRSDFGPVAFGETDADFRQFGCLFRFAEILNYRPPGSASAMRQVQELAQALPEELRDASALASSAGLAAGLLKDSTLLNGENRRPPADHRRSL